ncbi:hypothetical protein MKX03_020017 [Papaver bracteatum]|nr:hypothetical protein MKX03_020017 [Papaver bracteatum]
MKIQQSTTNVVKGPPEDDKEVSKTVVQSTVTQSGKSIAISPVEENDAFVERRAEQQPLSLDKVRQYADEKNKTLRVSASCSRVDSLVPSGTQQLLIESAAIPKLYVGNLNYQITDAEFIAFFKNNGCGDFMYMLSSKEDDLKFKGSYTIQLSSLQDTDTALNLNGSTLKGRPIFIASTEPGGDMDGKMATSSAHGYDKHAVWVYYVNDIQKTDIFTLQDLEDLLIEHFAICGEIIEVIFSFDKNLFEAHKKRGQVEIVFSDEEAVRRALRLAPSYRNVDLTVELAKHNI